MSICTHSLGPDSTLRVSDRRPAGIRHVVSLAGGVEPDSHYSMGRWIVEHFFRAAPVGPGFLVLAVAADEETGNEATESHQEDETNDDSHVLLPVIGEGDRGAVGNDFGQGLSDLRRIEPHRHDALRAQ